jgi:hypothetical protein
VVYTPDENSTEEVVWQAVSNDTTQWILTTARMADLKSGHYMTLADVDPQTPKQYCYLHKSKNGEGSAAIDFLCLGNTNTEPRLPISSLNGSVAEFVVYNRVLSVEERTRVESYLAIKYGIMLGGPGPALYRSAHGDELWNGYTLSPYNHRITGLGRDDASGLMQMRSTSSYAPGFMTISHKDANSDLHSEVSDFPDQALLLWGDNNGRTDEWTRNASHSINQLERKWCAVAQGAVHEIPVSLAIERNRLPHHTMQSKTYWLLMDRTGSGSFHPEFTDLIRGTVTSTEITFDSILFDTDRSGTDVITIASTGEVGLLLHIDRASCGTGSNGKFQYKVFSGKAPYEVTLTAPNGQFSKRMLAEDVSVEETATMVGEYTIRLIDMDGHEHVETFVIDHADGPQVCLDDQYYLVDNEEVALLEQCAPASAEITWSTSGKTLGTGPELRVRTPGTYEVEVIHQGCMTRKSVQVISALSSTFQSYLLYPNPIAEPTPLHLDITLTKRNSMTLQIIDVQGRLLRSGAFQPAMQFTINQEIRLPAGTYYCKLESGSDILTIPFVVQ